MPHWHAHTSTFRLIFNALLIAFSCTAHLYGLQFALIHVLQHYQISVCCLVLAGIKKPCDLGIELVRLANLTVLSRTDSCNGKERCVGEDDNDDDAVPSVVA